MSVLTDVSRVMLVGLLVWGAHRVGAAAQLCMAVLVLGVPVTLGLKVWGGTRGEIVRNFPTSFFRVEHRALLATYVLRVGCFALLATVLDATLLEWQMDPESLLKVRRTLWGSALLHAVLGAFPHREAGRVTPALLGLGVVLLSVQWWLIRVPQPLVGAVALGSPVRGTWWVMMGGPSTLMNHHAVAPSMEHALDLVMLTPDGRWMTGETPKPDAFPSWGQEVLAPAAGRVVAVAADFEDPLPGQPARGAPPMGNHVVMQLEGPNAPHVLLGHLMRHSVKVAVGDAVGCGQVLGRVGNSGGAGAPHLHVQLLNGVDVMAPGARSLPFALGAQVTRDGLTLPADVMPQRGDRLVFSGACPAR